MLVKTLLSVPFMLPLLAGFSTNAQADSAVSSWSILVGPAYVDFREDVRLSVGGAPVPGASASVQNNTTLAAEVSHHFTPNWSAGLTVGIPPRSAVTGTGTAEAFGLLGAVRYGAVVGTAKYTLDTLGSWRPYLGAGAAYYVVVKDHDAFISDLKVKNRFGTALQAGVEYTISPSIGIAVDVKKLFVKTTASGTIAALGGAPAHADVTLNPVVFQVGAVVHF